MHEQSRLNEGKDFGDAKIVSGMGSAHGKRGGKKRARRMEETGGSGNRKLREDAKSQSGGKLPPLVPIIQAPPQVDGFRVRTGRRHGRPVVGFHS